MNRKSSHKGLLAIFMVALALAVPLQVHAVKHAVAFGGSLGDVFSPKSFTAKVGDTVQWTGAFGPHILQSTTIPVGAAAWGPISSGTTFSYVIKVAGTFNYECTIHVSMGMVGSFTVTASAVKLNLGNAAMSGLAAQIRNAGNHSFLHLNLESKAAVSVVLFGINGRETAAIVNASLDRGEHEIPLTGVRPGNYVMHISLDGRQIVQKIFVAG